MLTPKFFEQVEMKSSTEVTKVANKYYKELPKDDDEFLKAVEPFIYSDNIYYFSLGTLWLKKRKTILDLKYMDIYEKWVYEAIHGWWECDQICGRLFNLLMQKYPDEMYGYILKWTDSPFFDQKRIGIVALTGTSLTVVGPIDKVFFICDKMKGDQEVLIQKAVGWVLKYCYKDYQSELVDYLKENVESLSRTTFRYALEKLPRELKQELMKL